MGTRPVPDSAATCSSVSCFRPQITTVAPSRANACAMARPIPRLAPVTTATLSFRTGLVIVMIKSPNLTPIKKTADFAKSFLTRHAFNQLLGLELVRTHRDGVTIQCRLRPDLMNGAGMLHGGVTASVADAAVGIALYHRFRGARRFTTVEL